MNTDQSASEAINNTVRGEKNQMKYQSPGKSCIQWSHWHRNSDLELSLWNFSDCLPLVSAQCGWESCWLDWAIKFSQWTRAKAGVYFPEGRIIS